MVLYHATISSIQMALHSHGILQTSLGFWDRDCPWPSIEHYMSAVAGDEWAWCIWPEFLQYMTGLDIWQWKVVVVLSLYLWIFSYGGMLWMSVWYCWRCHICQILYPVFSMERMTNLCGGGGGGGSSSGLHLLAPLWFRCLVGSCLGGKDCSCECL
jgi:hypothetical protein